MICVICSRLIDVIRNRKRSFIILWKPNEKKENSRLKLNGVAARQKAFIRWKFKLFCIIEDHRYNLRYNWAQFKSFLMNEIEIFISKLYFLWILFLKMEILVLIGFSYMDWSLAAEHIFLVLMDKMCLRVDFFRFLLALQNA